jgi:hypothetical protein
MSSYISTRNSKIIEETIPLPKMVIAITKLTFRKRNACDLRLFASEIRGLSADDFQKAPKTEDFKLRCNL